VAYGNSAKTLKNVQKLPSSDRQFSDANFAILKSPNPADGCEIFFSCPKS